MKFATIDPKGNRKVYEVLPLDRLVVRDWIDLTAADFPKDIVEGFEQTLELARRHTKIPKRVLDKMPARDVHLLVGKMAETLEAALKAKEAAERATPKSFTFKKVTYIVPQNIEAELTFGQWESLNKVLLPKCETDAEGYTSILAVCCLPEGEEFDGAKVAKRLELFMDLPLRTAFDVCAFFFDNSEQLRSSISLIARRARTSLRLRVEQALKTT